MNVKKNNVDRSSCFTYLVYYCIVGILFLATMSNGFNHNYYCIRMIPFVATSISTTPKHMIVPTSTLYNTKISNSSYDVASENVNNETGKKVEISISSQLDDILRSKSTILFEKLNDIRQNGTQEDVEMYLNDILVVIDGKTNTSESLPWWTKFRVTARISKRSRIASLRRVLDLSTPSVEETNDLGDDVDAKIRRRRRALLVLLRSLAATNVDDEDGGDKATIGKRRKNNNTIYKIEKAAKKDVMRSTSSKDMESRLPPGLETPKYEVIVRRPTTSGNGGQYEVRQYEAFSVCSVPMMKPRPNDLDRTDQKVRNPQLSGASSFGALAGYLFGKNEDQKAMKMTTPVLTQGEGDSKEMSFVLPSDYWSNDGFNNAPKPLQDSLVQVKREEGGYRAAIMFGGFASKKDVDAKKKELIDSLKSDKEWVSKGNEVTIAQYNDPFTPPWKRRNEVSITVTKRD